MKVINFTKQNLPEIRKQINSKLSELKSLGLDIKLGNINFNDTSFTSKIECRVQGVGGVSIDPLVEAFNQSPLSHNCKDAIGTKVTFFGNQYIFKGFKPGARVKPAIIERNGKMFRVEFNAISSQLV